jgi:hypothetical protein
VIKQHWLSYLSSPTIWKNTSAFVMSVLIHLIVLVRIIINMEQVYHADRYCGYKGPGWEEWLRSAHYVTVELNNRIDALREREHGVGSKKKGKEAKTGRK